MKTIYGHCRRWSMAHPYLFTFIGFVFFFIFFSICKVHSNEPTSSQLCQDSIVDALESFAAGIGAFEAAATGNFPLGVALSVLSGIEATKAWNEAKQAWDSRDGNSDNGGACGSMGTENNH